MLKIFPYLLYPIQKLQYSFKECYKKRPLTSLILMPFSFDFFVLVSKETWPFKRRYALKWRYPIYPLFYKIEGERGVDLVTVVHLIFRAVWQSRPFRGQLSLSRPGIAMSFLCPWWLSPLKLWGCHRQVCCSSVTSESWICVCPRPLSADVRRLQNSGSRDVSQCSPVGCLPNSETVFTLPVSRARPGEGMNASSHFLPWDIINKFF